MAPETSNRTTNGILEYLGLNIALGVLLVVAIAALAFLGTGGQTLEQRRAENRIAVRTRLEKEAQDKLNSDGWVDKAKGLVHVSIADAIPLAALELNKKKPAPSQIKVEAPLLPVVMPPDSKEPAPPLLPSAPQGANTIRFVEPEAPAAPAAPAPAAPAAAAPTTSAPAPAATAPAAPAPAPAAVAAPAPPAKPATPSAPAP